MGLRDLAAVAVAGSATSRRVTTIQRIDEPFRDGYPGSVWMLGDVRAGVLHEFRQKFFTGLRHETSKG